MNQFRSFREDLCAFAGKRLWLAAALVIVGALLDAMGILALIPIFMLVIGQAGDGLGSRAIDGLLLIGLDTPLLQACALSFAFLLLIAARGAIQRVRDIYLTQLGSEYADHVRSRAFRAISNAPWVAVLGYRRGDIEHTIVKDAGRLSRGSEQLLRTAAPTAMVISQVAIIAALAPAMLAVAAVLLVMAAIIGFPLARKSGLLGSQATKSGRRLQGVLGDFLGGQKLARVNEAQGDFAELLDAALARSRKLSIDLTASEASIRALFQTLAAVAAVMMLLIGYFFVGTPPTRLIIVTILTVRLVAPMQAILLAVQAISNMLPAHASMTELTSASLTTDNALPRGRLVTSIPIGNHSKPASLVVDGVNFSYTPGKPVLDGFSFSISPGEMVAIRGPSGCGKTTMLDIVTGLLCAEQGTVSVDGAALVLPEEWQIWRKQIAYLPQDPFLFDATLRENVAWFHSGASDDAILNALDMALAKSVLERFPEGLDARAGERGQALSGGERQRICLARAFLVKPRMLILDEAMNALDEDISTAILARLQAWPDRPTILLVSHRGEHLAAADRTIDMGSPAVAQLVPQIQSGSGS